MVMGWAVSPLAMAVCFTHTHTGDEQAGFGSLTGILFTCVVFPESDHLFKNEYSTLHVNTDSSTPFT